MKNAQFFLNKMGQSYASCNTYEDAGQIVRKGGRETVTTTFSTKFLRDTFFNFAWTDASKGKFEIVDEHNSVHIESPKLGVVERLNLSDVLAESAGISHGATSYVPSLLIGRTTVLSNIHLDFKFKESQMDDPISAYHLIGSMSEPDDFEIWLDHHYFIRHIRSTRIMSSEVQNQLHNEALRIASSQGIQLPNKICEFENYNLNIEFRFDSLKFD